VHQLQPKKDLKHWTWTKNLSSSDEAAFIGAFSASPHHKFVLGPGVCTIKLFTSVIFAVL
jgi:hypothetical protein